MAPRTKAPAEPHIPVVLLNVLIMEDEFMTLILENSHFKVNKEKLITKSRYFQCLFSHNFNDSRNKEHIINYGIALSSLQNFIEWIHDNEPITVEHNYFVKPSMKKYESNYLSDLLNLLQLSVLFVVDDLINDITDIIVLHWLHLEKIIDIWLLVQGLGIQVLRDICFAICLDRFADLPISSLMELSINDLKQLVVNVNVRSTEKYICHVVSKWVDYNKDRSRVDVGNLNISKLRKPKFVHCMVGYKTENCGTKMGYISFWDGIQLLELTELKANKSSGKEIVGMQVTGRGFSIYIIGGEYGFGTGQFSMIIWRFCLISKKWYYFARLPRPRRHMVVGFLGDRLIVVGGVGRHRVKLSSVETLNIHTGEWESVANVPECFTEVPPHCVMKKKLFLLKSSLYIFCPELGLWKTVTLSDIPLAIKIADGDLENGIIIFMLNDLEITGNAGTVCSRISNTQSRICDECLKLYINEPMVHAMYSMDRLDSLFVPDVGIITILMKYCESSDCKFFQLHNETGNDKRELSLVPRIGSCYIIDPKTLYN